MKGMIVKGVVLRSILVSTMMTSLVIFYTTVFASSTPNETLNYYSSDYHESRDKFLAAANTSGGHVSSYQNTVVGPGGKPLYIDVASFGSDNPKAMVVLCSGTHGVEGFAGSAIQVGLLRQGIVDTLGENVGLVMIHAMNPYGFAHLRRVNEDNVDLNRNFLNFAKALPGNKGYDQLADAISPESLSVWDGAMSRIRILWYRLLHGKLALQRATSAGQYTRPKGIFYGGSLSVWSNNTIKDIAYHHLSKAKRVVIIDVHTGLGPYGNGEVIMNISKQTPAYQRAVQWWGDIVRTTVTGESVSPHLYGTLKLAFPGMLPNSEVTAVSLEFGTYPPKDIFWALRTENWLHHYGGINHPDSKKIKNDLLRVFYPDDNQWKLSIWQKGSDALKVILRRLQPNHVIKK
jgi:hypothetical protein